jgi:hypothetical protein
MKKLSLISLGILGSLQFTNAQVITSKKWSDLFSYNNVLAMKEDNGKIIAATENGIFYYTISTGEITKLSKANGLHDTGITAFDYNPQTKTGLIGYSNGSLDIITPNEIKYVVDIPIATGYNGSKKINHISITGDQAVLSVGYGLSIFNLKKQEFGDSTFFMSGAGLYEASNEAIIYENKVYSVTNNGLKTHEMNTTFPVYATWTTEVPGSFKNISAGSSIVFSSATSAYLYNSGTPTPLPGSFGNIQDVVATSGNIVVTDLSRIFTFGANGVSQGSASVGEDCNTAIIANGKVLGGTMLSGIKDEAGTVYKPSGPYSNYSYKINLYDNNQMLISSGARTDRYNGPAFNPKKPGFYYFTGAEWVYPSFFVGNPNPVNVLDAVLNPSDPSEVFFANYTVGAQGVYRMKYNPTNKDFDLVKHYDLGNTNQYYSRPVGFTMDDRNNFYVSVSFYDGESAVGIYNASADNFIIKKFLIASNAVQKPLYYENMLWIPLPRSNNFLVYDYKDPANLSDDVNYVLRDSNGLPGTSKGSISVAIDKSGDAWIGSDTGLRILPNAASAIKEADPQVSPIIIEQNGLGEELFRDGQILQVEVDAGNQKWVSVDGGGVYYLSPDGQQTLKHFTKENSPLPTNSVTDIKVDKQTGKVYFATYNGVVAYQGDVADVTSNFGNIVVYPNPVVYSNFKGKVTIKGLAEKTNIRITDAAGNVVHSAVARGGYYEWDLNSIKGKRVASGIYFVLMTNEDASDKATAKIAVVN